jgi:membrane fusion protein, multidrug efflux system
LDFPVYTRKRFLATIPCAPAAAQLALVALLWPASLALSQRPPSPVRYTEAREHAMGNTVRLPGSVEAPTISTVAGEVDGLVVKYSLQAGDRVKKDQILAQLRTQNLELQQQASEADLREAEARLKLAERNLSRSQELFDSQVFSQQELDQSLYEFNAWQGRIGRLQAEIERIADNIARATIRAPFDGVIVAKRTELGQWLGAGDPVVDLMSVTDLQISVDVPDRYFSGIAAGRRVRLEFPALGGWQTTGTVDKIIPRADAAARTFPVKLKFADPKGRAVAGMMVDVSFPGNATARATIVPKDGVVSQGGRQLVYVIENGTANAVPVETGAGAGSWIEVRGAVRPGQQVVTRGNERLFPGQPVEGQPAEYPLP